MSRYYNNKIIDFEMKGWKCDLPLVKFMENENNKNKLLDKNSKQIYNGKYDPWNYKVNEQYLVNKWILQDDTVLEISPDIGIVSLTINSRLRVKEHHTVIEENSDIIKVLENNKEKFHAKFKIYNQPITKKIINNKLKYNVLVVNGNICILDILNTNPDLIEYLELLIFNILVCDIDKLDNILTKNNFILRDGLFNEYENSLPYIFQVWSK